MYLRDITNTFWQVLRLTVRHLSICLSCDLYWSGYLAAWGRISSGRFPFTSVTSKMHFIYSALPPLSSCTLPASPPSSPSEVFLETPQTTTWSAFCSLSLLPIIAVISLCSLVSYCMTQAPVRSEGWCQPCSECHHSCLMGGRALPSAMQTTDKPQSPWAECRCFGGGIQLAGFVARYIYTIVSRGNAGWTTSKIGHTCPCQDCSQGPPPEKVGRGSLLICPPDDPVG